MSRINNVDLDEFTTQFLETALWCDTVCLPCAEEDLVDGYLLDCHILRGVREGSPLDRYFDLEDFTETSLRTAAKVCAEFYAENYRDLLEEEDSQSGHDFWLTRTGQGAGFWDGDYDEAKGKRLTQACQELPEITICVNEDGTLDLSQF